MSKDRPIDDLDRVPDEAEGAQYVPSSAGSQGKASDDDRTDPSSDEVAGRDDTGARGRDRDNGGWGDRGIGGGRAGGTGL
jgi:hypothetical protein